ncbi:MAG: HPr family phosphocarrier protein [Gemmatimonadetes bacterium]|nr:HPr family phosphocarrier protein [Gemmatimonadota bacterium]
MAVAVAERVVRIVNELGLHARPSAEFVKLAGRFRSDISLARDDMRVNGKSIMGVMTLAAERGSELTIRAEGEDAEAAAAALADLVNRGFTES